MSDRQTIAEDVAHDLGHTERSFNSAIASVSTLLSRLPAYEQEARVSPVSTQSVYEELSAACASVIEARGRVVRGHRKLDAMQRALKLTPVTASGPLDKPPSDTPPDFMQLVDEHVA